MTLVRELPKTDHHIQLDVIAEIERDWRFKPAEIGVEVDHGVVTLSGTVSSYLKVGEAADVATRVPGVKDVANKLIVRPPDSIFMDDTKIAQAVRNSLVWDSAVPEERIDSVVRNGVVTLRGTVDYWYQRRSAVEVVKRITGVLNVNDHIIVTPPERTDVQMFDELKGAIRRRFPMEGIDATVDHATVTLMGEVPSYYIYRETADLASSTTGVKHVINKLRIAP
ncbi:MAG: BON domain-containing protein [Chloroflexota bacterium]